MATGTSSWWRAKMNHFLDRAARIRATIPALAVMEMRMAKIALDEYLKAMDKEDEERAQADLDEAEDIRRLQTWLNSLSSARRDLVLQRAFHRVKLEGRR